MRSSAVTVLSLVLFSCSPEPGVAIGGTSVASPASLLQEAAALLADVGSESVPVAVSASSSCFFVRDAEGSVSDFLLCGPVAVQGGAGPWVEVAVELRDGVHAPAGIVRVGVASPPAAAVVGAAGERPPSDLYLPPPPAAVGTLLARPSMPASVLMVSRSGWSLSSPLSDARAASPAVTVSAVARVRTLYDGYDRISAPLGAELLVLDVDRRPDVAPSDLSVVIAGTPVSSGSLERYLVAVVPDGSQVELRLTSAGVVQSLDLGSGTRSGSAPRLWNSSPTLSPSAAVSASRSVALPPVSLPDTPASVQLEAGLAFSATVEPPVLRMPSGRLPDPGMMILPVLFRDVMTESPSRYLSVAARFEVSASDPSGTVYRPSETERLPASQARVFVQVPEEEVQLTVEVAPFLLWEARSFSSSQEGYTEAEREFLTVEIFWR